ncbi:MAG: sodium:alanine symporter family protein [Rubricoccaceae bacterium]|nr:sodium:alanine symporter family protein [Rubricoccaceae bacterium]
METLQNIISRLEYFVWSWPEIGGELSLIVLALLGTGVYLTFRLGFIQLRRLGHGIGVTSGKYDDPDEPGDVPHFQALTTALSATVGIGNIAGVAIAIHWGGPGALFWMWVTALLGMAVKYSEVTLAQHYRVVEFPDRDSKAWEGSVSGGPMYYIEKGLGPRWKPLAVFFAGALMVTSFLTGNAVQANTVADIVNTEFGLPVWITGLVTAGVVGLVIIGGIGRIGKVTGVLAPAMALIYVAGALAIILANIAEVPAAFALIFTEAFNPSAGVAGTGTGVFLLTMMWGVRRGLFSNEAGQGSAPIAHAAAKTDEPVSEGVVALLEPLIDTIIICSMTGLVIITTGVWNTPIPTTLDLSSGDITYVAPDDRGIFVGGDAPPEIRVEGGQPIYDDGARSFAWHDVAVEQFFVDEAREQAFTGRIVPGEGRAYDETGSAYTVLFGDAVETAAPLTSAAFERGLGQFGLGGLGKFIVLISVLLFAISTSISWSYYGDRCANYLFGSKGILPFKAVFVLMHFVGAITTLAWIWVLGDIALGLVTFPNLIALVLLSGVVVQLTKSYFERKPWIQNAEDHKRAVERERAAKSARK